MNPTITKPDSDKPTAPPVAEKATVNDVLSKLVERLEAQEVAKPAKFDRNYKRPEPPKICPPGYAIVTDHRGVGRKMVHLAFVMKPQQEVRPIEMQFGGRAMLTGQLYDLVTSRQLIVEQFCPYPPGHVVKGNGATFPANGYTNVDGVYYHQHAVPGRTN